MRKVYDGPTLPMWAHVEVETFCGVKIKCEIIEVRRMASCAAYTVKPREDREEELRKAGVPKGDWQSPFTAFDWQVRAQQPDLSATKPDAQQARVIRRAQHKGAGYIST